ncbi:hypothetical protein SSX86_028222 [Deinandra increscens subsp. villosa]|uniref:DC1 domain-containing protein n=1 Tax=Deinandra increscens subsp. villosa TaxID=3103831 RepID=A0AAP0C8B1_9ASTR
MDQGYKHFSHLHNLIMHQMPEGIDVSCSGCHSSATGTVYVCWQCNFFLHDQCYYATRSLKHPSHPPHPLTLVPYPTYQSNSFYCNSCEIIGTGFSYSCADCEFDLHVQCAHSISGATSLNNAHQFQELVPQGWKVGVPNLASVSIPMGSQNPLPNALYPPNMFPSSQDPSMPQGGPSVSIPMSSQDQIASAQYPSMDQTRPSFSAHHPPNQFPSVQDPSMPQNGPSVFIPTSTEYHSIPQTGPPVSIPTNYPLNSTPYSQDHSMPQTSGPSVSIPTSFHNSSPQNPSMEHSITSSHDPSRPQTGLKDQETKHFSHPHNLSRVSLKEDEENEVICSGCEDALVGNGYSCVQPDCEFHLHESCFHLKKEIHHKSHPEHPLTLLPLAPYDNADGQFTCSACFSDGTGFTYHCSICEFDLHIQCVNLPETAKRDDHEHTLKLLYSCPVQKEDYTFYCGVCHEEIQRDRWGYYCEPCDYGTHLGCVDCEVCERESNQSVSILDTQAQLQRLQLQMQMARQQAQFMASCGASLASLA